MCRVEERVYVTEDGHRQAFEESFRCDQARPGKLCRNVKRKTVEYLSPRPPQVSRDDASSPASYDPPTPTGSGPYMVETRAPAAPGRRPSTRDGTRVIKPEIIIEFGARKDKSKKYRPGSTKYKRSSLGTSSINSNDVAVESPGSEASYTVRTGFPEASIQQPEPSGYTTQPTLPRGHRHTSSASSHTTSSQPPSLYATSDPDSPSHRRAPRYPPTIVHNPPPSPTATRGPAPVPSSPYRTTIAEPKKHTENVGADGIFPVDYSSFASSSRPSSSRAVAAAPEIFDRDADRARQRAEKKRQQEEADLEMARKIQQEEDARQAAIELGRAKARAEERAENAYAQMEKRRFEDREELRRQKQQQQDEKERAAREARKEAERVAERVRDTDSKHRKKERDSRPPTRDPTKRTRRRSMSQHDIIERERLIAAEKARMAVERSAAEIRDREEQAALFAEQQARANLIRQQQEQASLLRQSQEQVTLPRQQEDPHYWDPRGGNRLPMTNNTAGMGRRNSLSARRGSISATPGVQPPPIGGLDRRNSTRRPSISISQPAPPGNLPPINTGLASAQPSSFVRPPSARHSSYDQENPFALPPTRVSNTSQDNPFTTSATWDTREMREALPRESLTTHARQPSDDRFQHSLRRRGEEVIERAAADGKSRKHDRARQATRNISKVVGFEDDYEKDDSGDEVNRGYETRGKHSKSGGKRRAQ